MLIFLQVEKRNSNHLSPSTSNQQRITDTTQLSLYPNVAYPRRGKTRQSVPDVNARRLGEDDAYLTVREILSEASTLADGALSGERSDFYRFGYATLGFTQLCTSWDTGTSSTPFLDSLGISCLSTSRVTSWGWAMPMAPPLRRANSMSRFN
jgi:hypothetical protein